MTRTILVTFLVLASEAIATTFYISPQGADSRSGASESDAWATFTHALPQLNPGDTLMLANGRYEALTTGLLNADCSSGIKRGTATEPILVRASSERQAWLVSDGSTSALRSFGCAFWHFEGLRVSSGDARSPSNWYPVSIESSEGIELRRLLVTHSNRFVNSHLIDVLKSQSILIEESEFYWFSRAAVSFSFVDGGVIRRSYANSRGYTDIDGGYGCCDSSRGDVGFEIWNAASSVYIDNSVSEGQVRGFEVSSFDGISKVQISGSISLGDFEGARVLTTAMSSVAASSIAFEQFLAARPREAGLAFHSTKEGRCTHCSILGGVPGLQVGLAADRATGTTGTDYSTSITDTLVTNVSGGPGMSVTEQSQWDAVSVNAFNTHGGFAPWPGNYSGANEIDPMLGSCTAYIPKTSSMHGRGSDGGDIGANVLYRYQNGVQTCESLWDRTTGTFPCGAVIAGVNDISDSSCTNVHLRLNVGTTECPLPVEDDRCRSEPDGGLGGTASRYTIGCACSSATDGLWLGAGLLFLRHWRRRLT